ncbi:MAG TPA: hypothetical protein VM097_12040 [Mycobacteriales bacterium]|nr:hypothetical protein [Mycobacteriales bacterium]
MSPRLVLAGAVVAVLGGGLAAPALAGTDSTPQRDKVCVQHPSLLPEGYCITWNNPLGPVQP